MRSLGLRRRLFLVVFVAVALAVAALVLGFNLVLARVLDNDARDLVRSRAAAQLSSLRFEDRRLTAGEADQHASDANVWVFQGSRLLTRPRVGAIVDAAARRLTDGPTRTLEIPSADSRLYAVPVIQEGRRVGTVVAGVSLEPYEKTRATALVASVVFGALVLVIVGGTTWWLLGASLRPVVRMTRQAAAWSEESLDNRFALGRPYDELTELAATLDGLLDRLAASLRHERRFSAELSHELRTPLAHVLAEAELALGRQRAPADYRAALETIHSSAYRLSRTVDALVAAAAYEAGRERGTADAERVAAGATAACAGLAREREVEVEVASASPVPRVGVDAELAERILQPVVENACRYGTNRVRVAVAREDTSVVYAVEDDGPGVADDERERIFEPGVRGRAQGSAGGGAGLGLSLARRLARSVDGEVRADPTATGGRFLVRLPAG
jgi:signal transduction histidine kinase